MTRGPLEFVVHGTPVPQGSKRVFGGRAVDANAKRLRPWRLAVASAAAQALGDDGVIGWVVEPLTVGVTFRLPRPKSHYAKDGSTLRTTAPKWAPRNPDIDKLLRALFDGMTDAGVWRDDAQVVGVLAQKRYADAGPGAQVVVLSAHDAQAALWEKEQR